MSLREPDQNVTLDKKGGGPGDPTRWWITYEMWREQIHICCDSVVSGTEIGVGAIGVSQERKADEKL